MSGAGYVNYLDCGHYFTKYTYTKTSSLTPLLLLFSCPVMSNSLQPHGLQPDRLLCPWNFPGRNTGLGCHFLLQGIFLTQGVNPHLLQVSCIAGKFFTANPLGLPCVLYLRYKQFLTLYLNKDRKKYAKVMNRHLLSKDIEMAYEHMKKYFNYHQLFKKSQLRPR